VVIAITIVSLLGFFLLANYIRKARLRRHDLKTRTTLLDPKTPCDPSSLPRNRIHPH